MPAVLQINATANLGSTGRIAEGIGQAAMRRGWKSYIAYGRAAAESSSAQIRIGRKRDILWHGVLTRLLDRHGLGSVSATRKLLAEIEEIRPDVVHLHNIHGYYLNYEELFGFLKSAGIPVVWTMHDCWAMTGHCVHFELAGCDKWLTQCRNCPQKKEYPASFFLDDSRRNHRRKKQAFTGLATLVVVCVSQWQSRLLKESFLKEYPSRVIRNGIDVSCFSPCGDPESTRRKYSLRGKRIVLGVANQWTERKGLNDFRRLRPMLPAEFEIVLVGVTETQRKSLPPGISGIGRTKNVNELAELYSLADWYLNLTYEDNFPTTNLESLACGTPVLTYRTGGSPEALAENIGILVDQGDLQEVAKQVSQPGRSEPAGRAACRRHATEHYDQKRCFENYVSLYEQLSQHGTN